MQGLPGKKAFGIPKCWEDWEQQNLWILGSRVLGEEDMESLQGTGVSRGP